MLGIAAPDAFALTIHSHRPQDREPTSGHGRAMTTCRGKLDTRMPDLKGKDEVVKWRSVAYLAIRLVRASQLTRTQAMELRSQDDRNHMRRRPMNLRPPWHIIDMGPRHRDRAGSAAAP